MTWKIENLRGHQWLILKWQKLKVFVMVYKMSLVPLVHPLTSFFNVLGQSWGAAAEHTHFTHLQTARSRWLKSPFISFEGD